MKQAAIFNCQDLDGWAQCYIDFLGPTYQCTVYDVFHHEYPTDDELADFDVFAITGSTSTAYVIDSPPDGFVTEFGSFTQKLMERVKASQSSNQKTQKLIGICFGHQIIAHYCGGRTESKNSFTMGTDDILLSEKAKTYRFVQKALDSVGETDANFAQYKPRALKSHQDRVTVVPDDAIVLAGSDNSSHELLVYGDYCLTSQFHPELTNETINKLLVPLHQRTEPDFKLSEGSDFSQSEKDHLFFETLFRAFLSSSS
ncbi:putative Gamma-glutamyl peptidase 5 [Blattamonas nauphoetae]|uniref:Gamma-glutamyl peptidase 5 n=1 Tax=Blattamonas nauphoetae TaxID=2049346 RepID=A0ABQ9YGX8_9EUKA|nr:putative Gamma-glutamyl peptidase 5 [Blattamonas nauphoetae]